MVARPRLALWLIALLLVLVTAALYWPAITHDFVNFDDHLYVNSNVHAHNGLSWDGIKWACLNPVADNWHPLTVWTHMLACQVFGLKPWGHHLINVLLHAFNAALVFALLQQMTGATWRSLAVAVLFAVHPLRVESVAWVSERKDVLSGFFGLLALITYARYAQGRKKHAECRTQTPGTPQLHVSRFAFHAPRPLPTGTFYLLSLVFFTLGLMSKPMLVTLPFVLLLLDYWPLRRFEPSTPNSRLSTIRPLVREKLPFFALAAVASALTFAVQQRGSSLAMGQGLTLNERLGNALISYCRHLGKLFCPVHLAVAYPHPGQWSLGMVLLAGGLILGISVLCWLQRRRAPFLLMGWLWYCGMLVPVIGLVQTGGQALADRHTYLPSLGMLLLAIWGACELTRRWRHQVLALSVAGGVATVLCLALTRKQISYWRDSETLFRHALDVTKDNFLAQYNLGVALGEKGQLDEAIRHYQEAIRLKPDDVDAHNNLGVALGKKGQTDAAIRQYQETIRLKPGYALAHNNLATIFYQQGRTTEAIHQLQEALRLNPHHAGIRKNLNAILASQPDLPQPPGPSTNASPK